MGRYLHYPPAVVEAMTPAQTASLREAGEQLLKQEMTNWSLLLTLFARAMSGR